MDRWIDGWIEGGRRACVRAKSLGRYLLIAGMEMTLVFETVRLGQVRKGKRKGRDAACR